ncbi:reverse transcriptase [Tanacetum coccineum]
MQGSEGMLKQAELSSMALLPKDMPPQRSPDHQIPLMPNTPQISVRPYRHPPNQKDAIESIVKELMDSEVVREIKDKFPIPMIKELIDESNGSVVFSKLDLSKKLEQHCDHFAQVLQVMKDNTLYAKKSKCYFAVPQVEYLGYIISAQGVATDPSKIEAMQKWPIPSTLNQPLVALTKKDAFKWNPSTELAYHQLKEAMVKALVLALPNFEQEFVVETDASGKGIGAVLCQNGHPIAYWSKTLSAKHQALLTYKKEFLAVVATLEKWKGYLLDRHFKIKTKWTQVENFYRYLSLLSQVVFGTRRKGKVVVGNDPELRKELVQHFHDKAIGGHSGAHVTMKKLGSLFYWKGLKKMVKQMVRDCDVCQRQKPDLSAYPRLIQPLPIPERIWKEISMDFIEKLPTSSGKSVILVVVDRLCKYGYCIPLAYPFSASQVAQAFLDQVYKLNGLPESIVKLKLSTAYHLQTDGHTEVVNRSLECYLRFAERIGEVAYRLKLLSSSQIHLVFHISQLKKCQGKSHSMGVLPQLREDGLLENKPMAILERRLGKVNNKPVMFVLIQWTNKTVEKATWEIYGDLITRFPGLEKYCWYGYDGVNAVRAAFLATQTMFSGDQLDFRRAALAAIQETLANIQAKVRAHSTDIDNLKKGAVTSQPRTDELIVQQRPHPEPNNTSYGKLTWIEFPKFSGDNEHFEVEVVKRFGVLYDDPIIKLKNLKQTGSVQNYQEGFEALLNRANNLSESYQLAKMQEATNTILKSRYNTPLLPTPKQSTTTFPSKAVTTPVKSNSVGQSRHKCSGQLHSIEVICEGDIDNFIDGDDDTNEDWVGEMVGVTNTPQITLNAFSGLNSYQTMRIRGRVGKQVVHIIIDYGSTHNFLDIHTAKKLGCKLAKTTPMQVSVANGQRIMNTFVCHDMKWSLQNEVLSSDVMLLQLGGCEMVLGIQWLATLGDMQCNFKKLIMKFNHKGRQLVLRGMSKTHLCQMESVGSVSAEVEQVLTYAVISVRFRISFKDRDLKYRLSR